MLNVFGIVRVTKIEQKGSVVKLSIVYNDYKGVGHFFNAIAFKLTGEKLYNNISVKDRIMITSGTVGNNNWTDKEGKKHYSDQIIINQWEYVEKKTDQFDNTHANLTPNKNADQLEVDRKRASGIDIDEDSLPF